MKVLGVIPARYGSTRLPAKPLHHIAGKPLLQWVIEGARTSRHIDELVVATDHPEIAGLVEKLGVRAKMTASEIPSGSDRVWAAAQGEKADIVLNIQGDEPLISGDVLDRLLAPMLNDPCVSMATLATDLVAEDLQNPNVVKVVLDQNSNGIYFSRWAIPFSRMEFGRLASVSFKHMGIYAYRRDFLKRFCEHPPTPLEQCESLEQLRALYLGERIRVVVVKHESWGVDTPEDVKKIEEILKREGRHG